MREPRLAEMKGKRLSLTTASLDPDKKKGRARLSNGKELLPTVDGRSVWARYMRNIYGAVLAHCGGVEYASELKRLQARRIAVLESEVVHLEDEFARVRAEGGKPNLKTSTFMGVSPMDSAIARRLAGSAQHATSHQTCKISCPDGHSEPPQAKAHRRHHRQATRAFPKAIMSSSG